MRKPWTSLSDFSSFTDSLPRASASSFAFSFVGGLPLSDRIFSDTCWGVSFAPAAGFGLGLPAPPDPGLGHGPGLPALGPVWHFSQGQPSPHGIAQALSPR